MDFNFTPGNWQSGQVNLPDFNNYSPSQIEAAAYYQPGTMQYSQAQGVPTGRVPGLLDGGMDMGMLGGLGDLFGGKPQQQAQTQAMPMATTPGAFRPFNLWEYAGY